MHELGGFWTYEILKPPRLRVMVDRLSPIDRRVMVDRLSPIDQRVRLLRCYQTAEASRWSIYLLLVGRNRSIQDR
jgi:hypothetical protein